MYPNERKYSIILMTVIAVLTCIVCVVTLFSPWIHIGLPMEDGRYLDVNRVMDDLLDISADDLLKDLDKLELDDFEYLSPKAAKKQIRTTKKAVAEMVEILEDSKLTPAETASLSSNVKKLCDCLVELDTVSKEDIPTLGLTLASVLLWVLIVAVVATSVYGIYGALTGKKRLTLLCTILYGVIFLAFIALTIATNRKMEELLEELWYLSYFDFTSLSILRLRVAPFLGFVLLIGSVILQAQVPAIAEKMAGSAGTGSSAKDMLFWTCSCGASNRNAAEFCPKCGKAKVIVPRPMPEPSHWFCMCGAKNSRKNPFCPQCGAPRPVTAVRPMQPVQSMWSAEPAPFEQPMQSVQPIQPVEPIKPVQPESASWICTGCGAVSTDPDIRFCPACGHPRQTPQPQEETQPREVVQPLEEKTILWENF